MEEKAITKVGNGTAEVRKESVQSAQVNGRAQSGTTNMRSKPTGRPRGMPVIFSQQPVKKKIGGIPKCFLTAPPEKRSVALTDEMVRSRINASDVPDALKCQYSKELLIDAVMLPCCFQTCSYSAIQSALLAGNFVCPLCKAPNIGIDKLTPNKKLRDMVSNFINEQRQKMEAKLNSEPKESATPAEEQKGKLEEAALDSLSAKSETIGDESLQTDSSTKDKKDSLEGEGRSEPNQAINFDDYKVSQGWNYKAQPRPRQWGSNFHPGYQPPRGQWGRGPPRPRHWGPNYNPGFRGPPRGYMGPMNGRGYMGPMDGRGPGRGRPNWGPRGPNRYFDGPPQGFDPRNAGHWNRNESFRDNQPRGYNIPNERSRSDSRGSFDRSEGGYDRSQKEERRETRNRNERSRSRSSPASRNQSGRKRQRSRERQEYEGRSVNRGSSHQGRNRGNGGYNSRRYNDRRDDRNRRRGR